MKCQKGVMKRFHSSKQLLLFFSEQTGLPIGTLKLKMNKYKTQVGIVHTIENKSVQIGMVACLARGPEKTLVNGVATITVDQFIYQADTVHLLDDYYTVTSISESVLQDKIQLSHLVGFKITPLQYARTLIAYSQPDLKLDFMNDPYMDVHKEIVLGLMKSKHSPSDILQAMLKGLPLDMVEEMDESPASWMIKFAELSPPRKIKDSWADLLGEKSRK